VFRWLLRAALAALLFKLLREAGARRSGGPGPGFAPGDPSRRAKTHGGSSPPGPHPDPRDITDADYEEIPGAPR
jgi:hypothetical protein